VAVKVAIGVVVVVAAAAAAGVAAAGGVAAATTPVAAAVAAIGLEGPGVSDLKAPSTPILALQGMAKPQKRGNDFFKSSLAFYRRSSWW
jgi:hypothetical protein